MAEDLREQVAKQCDAVAHMAKIIGALASDYAKLFRDGSMSGLEDQVGYRSAYQMEALGNMINGVDAAEKEDVWMDPIFEEAHRLWPNAANEGRGHLFERTQIAGWLRERAQSLCADGDGEIYVLAKAADQIERGEYMSP